MTLSVGNRKLNANKSETVERLMNSGSVGSMNEMKSVKVGPITYEVVLVDDLHDGTTKLDGWVRYAECVVRLDSRLSPQSMRQTLWHEILHALVTQGGLKQDERYVDVLAYGIMEVLQDNPWLGRGVDHVEPTVEQVHTAEQATE